MHPPTHACVVHEGFPSASQVYVKRLAALCWVGVLWALGKGPYGLGSVCLGAWEKHWDLHRGPGPSWPPWAPHPAVPLPPRASSAWFSMTAGCSTRSTSSWRAGAGAGPGTVSWTLVSALVVPLGPGRWWQHSPSCPGPEGAHHLSLCGGGLLFREACSRERIVQRFRVRKGRQRAWTLGALDCHRASEARVKVGCVHPRPPGSLAATQCSCSQSKWDKEHPEFTVAPQEL